MNAVKQTYLKQKRIIYINMSILTLLIGNRDQLFKTFFTVFSKMVLLENVRSISRNIPKFFEMIFEH